MKHNGMLLVTAALAVFSTTLPAQPTTVECSGTMQNTKAVALTAGTTLYNVTDFSGSQGQLDPTPLLQTEITTNGNPHRPSCVVLTFSTQAAPQDNSIVFQASIDGIPMIGHGVSFYPTPIVWDPEETNLNLPRMLSYTFFANILPGDHTIRIKIAGCCSANPTTVLVVNAATMVIRY